MVHFLNIKLFFTSLKRAANEIADLGDPLTRVVLTNATAAGLTIS